jgi:hypothetical protein
MKVAIIYGGPGVSLAKDDTVECLERVAVAAGFRIRRFVQKHRGSSDPTLVESINGKNTDTILDEAAFAGAHLYLAPGSDEGNSKFGGGIFRPGKNNYATRNLMRAAGYDRMLKAAIEKGLGYVGICAGAYLGANDDSLDLAEADRSWATGAGEAVAKLTASTPDGTSVELLMPLLAGPKFAIPQTHVEKIQTIAKFVEPRHNPPAAAVMFRRGEGRVFLVGPHPEAPDNDEEWDPHGGSSWRQPGSVSANHRFLQQWLNATART